MLFQILLFKLSLFEIRNPQIWKYFYFCIHLFIFCFFGLYLQHMEVPQARWSNQSYNDRPKPQPQPCRIQASLITGSLTHWARPGIKLTFSWILVGLVTPKPQRGNLDIILNELFSYLTSHCLLSQTQKYF